MNRQDVFLAGLGGQGVLLAGQILAQAALRSGLEVSWFPAYSPEVRGGEATCTVVMADGPVGSPIVGRPRALVLMDAGSVERHLPRAAEGAIAVINSSLAPDPPRPDGVRVITVPANELAQAAGSERSANLVMLGALLAVRPVVALSEVEAAVLDALPAHRRSSAGVNIEALRAGYRAAGGDVSV
ncbi:MAG: 2-oxoacid:acceptor oxidoreductase family protein [Armatimonadetes bacterium]|nr:2-oxoacid:acceptor oxidoreductase family protein [Armatimonadota bacterium]